VKQDLKGDMVKTRCEKEMLKKDLTQEKKRERRCENKMWKQECENKMLKQDENVKEKDDELENERTESLCLKQRFRCIGW
jgi:polyribonucleotide nucleotidyltransferase